MRFYYQIETIVKVIHLTPTEHSGSFVKSTLTVLAAPIVYPALWLWGHMVSAYGWLGERSAGMSLAQAYIPRLCMTMYISILYPIGKKRKKIITSMIQNNQIYSKMWDNL